MVGTYVNRVRIEPNNPYGLNCGDLIGIGCPESLSTREQGGKETFVYKLKSPLAFQAQAEAVEAILSDDAPTPPPLSPSSDHGNDIPQSNNLPDVVRNQNSTRENVSQSNTLPSPPQNNIIDNQNSEVRISLCLL